MTVSGNQPEENPEGFHVYYCPKGRELMGKPASDHPAGEWVDHVRGLGMEMVFWCPGDHVAATAREKRG